LSGIFPAFELLMTFLLPFLRRSSFLPGIFSSLFAAQASFFLCSPRDSRSCLFTFSSSCLEHFLHPSRGAECMTRETQLFLLPLSPRLRQDRVLGVFSPNEHNSLPFASLIPAVGPFFQRFPGTFFFIFFSLPRPTTFWSPHLYRTCFLPKTDRILRSWCKKDFPLF